MIARLSMRAVSGAIFRWKEFVEETKHMRGLLQRASMALTKRCMVSAFAIWKEKMDEAAEALAAAQRVIGRVKYGAAWAKWREKVADAREHRELMHKAANFIVNRTKSSSFYTWRDNAETMADMRAKVAGFVARVANKEMSAAWEKWQNFLDDQEEARDAAERAMRWWANKEMRSAFERWFEALEGARAARSALRFFTHREISKAFERWSEFVENKREHEERCAPRWRLHQPRAFHRVHAVAGFLRGVRDDEARAVVLHQRHTAPRAADVVRARARGWRGEGAHVQGGALHAAGRDARCVRALGGVRGGVGGAAREAHARGCAVRQEGAVRRVRALARAGAGQGRGYGDSGAGFGQAAQPRQGVGV